MVDLLRRNGVLLLIALAMAAMYLQVSRPAAARARELRALERRQIEEVARLRDEARRMELQLEALRLQDPVLLERAVRGRFARSGDQTGLLPTPASSGLRGP